METLTSYPILHVAGAAAANGLLRLAEQGARKYGDLFAVQVESGPEVIILASNNHVGTWQAQPEAFEKDFDHFPTSASLTRLLLGPTLLTARDGPEWSQMRKEMTSIMRVSKPWFLTALEAATEQLVIDISNVADKGSFDIFPFALDWAVRSVCSPILGPAVSHAAAIELVEALQACFLAMVARGGAKAADYEDQADFRRAKAMISAVLQDAIAGAGPGDKTITASCLAAMPEGASPDLKRAELANVVIGLLAASLHINALALVWTISGLARNRELVDAIAHESFQGGDCAQQVTKTPIAFAAVREAQRLYPAVPLIERRLTKTMSFSGYEIPAGSTVLFAAWLIQRDARHWSDPTTFDAARFLPRVAHSPDSYLPFGVGARTCAGMNLVFHQLTHAISQVAGAFNIDLAPDCRPGDLAPVMRVNLEPRGEIRLLAKRRTASIADRPLKQEENHA